MYTEILYFLTTIMGIVMSLWHFFQAYKIYKTKSWKDVSLVTFSIFAIGSLIRLLYGLNLNQMPIVISFVIGLIGSGSVLFLSIKYRKK